MNNILPMINIDNLSKKLSKREHLEILANDLNNVDLSFEYKSDFKNAKELRDFVEALSDMVWIPKKWKHRLILITDEINNNAIEYGSLPEDVNEIVIKIVKDFEKIKINVEVKDSGRGKEPKTADEMYDLRDKKLAKGFENHTGIRGRGLFLIIQKTVDKLYFEDATEGGLIVWVEKNISLIEEKN